MDEIRLVPLWISDFLFYHVLSNALEYISRIRRDKRSEHDSYPAVDIPASVALGLSWHFVF